MVDKPHLLEEAVPLSEEQKIILMMSEEDIKAGRTIDQHILHDRELQWLNVGNHADGKK